MSLGLLAVLLLAVLKYRSWGIYLIILGGVSNLLDRVFNGQVTDYWHVGSLEFNLADTLILGGVLLVLYCLLGVRIELGKTEK